MRKAKKQELSPLESCEIHSDERSKKSRRNIKLTAAILILISIFLLVYTIDDSDDLQEEFEEIVGTYGLLALFILSLLLDLIPQIISPAIILASAILAGVNPYYAITATIIGSTIGSILGFVLGKKYVCKAVNLLTTKKSVRKITILTNKYGKTIVLVAAISPLPYLPVLFGAINLTKKNFIIYGIIPRIIGLTIYGLIANLL